MAQNVVDFTIDPTGVELLDDLLTDNRQNELTTNSGSSRPSYAVAGTIWLDTTTNPWIIKIFDGTNDIPLFNVDTATNLSASPTALLLAGGTMSGNLTVNANIVGNTIVSTDGNAGVTSTSSGATLNLRAGNAIRAFLTSGGLTVNQEIAVVGASQLTGTVRVGGTVTGGVYQLQVNGASASGLTLGIAGTPSANIGNNATEVFVEPLSSRYFSVYFGGVKRASIGTHAEFCTDGAQGAAYSRIKNASITQGAVLFTLEQAGSTASVWYGVNTPALTGGAAAAMKIGSNSSTLRSINATGTINANNTDGAEYYTKAVGCPVIAKGDIVAVNANGLLSDRYADAASGFLVKSTAPAWVGGDTWADGIEPPPAPLREGEEPTLEYLQGVERFEAELEVARQRVDRMAFWGRVPVNVTGAEVGQWVIPSETVTGGIEPILVDDVDITFAQFKIAIGRVEKILDDGRAFVRLK